MSKQFVCAWCGVALLTSEPKATDAMGDHYHLSCKAEEDDEAFFDRDMEFGDN